MHSWIVTQTEGVTWIVAKDPLRMTLDQWNQMRHVMGFNARPTQQQSGVGLSGAGSAVYGALAVAGLGALVL